MRRACESIHYQRKPPLAPLLNQTYGT
jgi:hypothetical protein